MLRVKVKLVDAGRISGVVAKEQKRYLYLAYSIG
jgi:hypothetical protein